MANHPMYELWEALRGRLSSPRMAQLLGGEGRVRLVSEDDEPEGAEHEAWGRLVIVPAEPMWPVAPGPFFRRLAFLTRAEVNEPSRGSRFDPDRSLGVVQVEAARLLEGWLPEAPMKHLKVALPVYLASGSQTAPRWDDDRGLWYTSAEYRTEIVEA